VRFGRIRSLPLLHHLQRCTQDCATEVGLLLPQRSREAVHPAGDETRGWNDGTLIFFVGDNLGQFDLNVLGFDWLSTKSGERVGGTVEISTLDKVTWGIGKEHQSTPENQTPGELNGNWNAVRSSVGTLFGRIHDTGGQEETNGDAELVTSDESTTNFLGALKNG
jgi:hypothetical protein